MKYTCSDLQTQLSRHAGMEFEVASCASPRMFAESSPTPWASSRGGLGMALTKSSSSSQNLSRRSSSMWLSPKTSAKTPLVLKTVSLTGNGKSRTHEWVRHTAFQSWRKWECLRIARSVETIAYNVTCAPSSGRALAVPLVYSHANNAYVPPVYEMCSEAGVVLLILIWRGPGRSCPQPQCYKHLKKRNLTCCARKLGFNYSWRHRSNKLPRRSVNSNLGWFRRSSLGWD